MLNFRKVGDGPVLVMLHGLFGSLENLGTIARILAENFTVYSVDLPNHGRSSHISGGSLAKYAESVVGWLDEQGLAHCHILGHSLGGKVAMEIALTATSRVDKLVVLDISPVQYPIRHQDVFDGLFAIDLNVIQSRGEANQTLSKYVQDEPVRTFLLKNLVKETNGFRWRMNLFDLKASYLNLIAQNSELVFTNPTLFLKGGDSDYIRREHQGEILRRFPHAQYKNVGGTGHWLHAEKPKLVSSMTQKFLTSN